MKWLVLQSPDIQEVVHAIPLHIASTFEIEVPATPTDEAAIKLFFSVPSLERARGVVNKSGGLFRDETWNGKGFTVCNAVDPEGHVFQARAFSDAD